MTASRTHKCSHRSGGNANRISDFNCARSRNVISWDTHVFVADTEHEVTALEVDLGEPRPEEKINVSNCLTAAGDVERLLAVYLDTDFIITSLHLSLDACMTRALFTHQK